VRKIKNGLAIASRFFVRAAVSLSIAAALINAAQARTETKYAAIVVDANSGKTLFSANADAPRHPASLTKMMTLYLLFEGLKSGRFTKQTQMPVSRHAANQAPSKLGLKPGQSISVETAILALVTKSANDAAAASGEFLGGSEDRFAQMMTAKARRIGMSRTVYKNASGLPNPAQITTARDQAMLGIALREHFPEYYRYFSTRTFNYGRRRIGNHNKLLGRVAGVDGIKTGYTRASGFNLVSSVKQGNRQLVAVVLGGKSGRARDQHMASLIGKYTPKAVNRDSMPLLARLIGKKPEPIVIEEAQTASAEPAAETVASVAERPAQKEKLAPAVPVLAYAAPVPAVRPKALVAAEEAAAAGEPAPVDPITTASSKGPSGWVIQIAAADSEAGARKLLSNAKFKGGRALASADPFTQAVEKGAATLYRARFSGFESKTAARNACAALKRNKVSCFALEN
jgi:D-alanyl-D-alanine carboxypeptidase